MRIVAFAVAFAFVALIVIAKAVVCNTDDCATSSSSIFSSSSSISYTCDIRRSSCIIIHCSTVVVQPVMQ
jgi:hypothetical protein